MEVRKYDYLVIGAGSGGIGSAWWTAKNYGKSVAVIEHQRLGGNWIFKIINRYLCKCRMCS